MVVGYQTLCKSQTVRNYAFLGPFERKGGREQWTANYTCIKKVLRLYFKVIRCIYFKSVYIKASRQILVHFLKKHNVNPGQIFRYL